MATAIRCERCGAAGDEVHCPECSGGLGLGTLFRQYEQLVAERPRQPAHEWAVAAQPGNRFGDFVRVRLLGDGGMGEIWKAWDRKLRRWVALKFPKCESAADLDQLKEEAASAGILSHPNVATIYGAGQANGHHFIAMQYIDGVTLAEYPRDDRRKLIAFVRYAAMGVACAHSHGIIHRDLKPENIMVSRDREQIYVTDFGIARRASSGSKATEVIGTPPYMSPEQARGERVDCRSDVYSLAATLYELLADRPPFIGASPADTLRRVLAEDPEPLRHLDADLNAILQKGLEKAPAERYPTVHEFAEDLRRYLQDEAVQARRPTLVVRARKMLKRHRTAALAGLAATLVVTALFLAGRREEERERARDERRHEALEAEAALAVADYTRALEARPDDASIRLRRGTLLLALGLAQKRPAPALLLEAQADFSKVVESDGPERRQAELQLRTIQDALAR
jgi:serine/threonine-protein kinase